MDQVVERGSREQAALSAIRDNCKRAVDQFNQLNLSKLALTLPYSFHRVYDMRVGKQITGVFYDEATRLYTSRSGGHPYLMTFEIEYDNDRGLQIFICQQLPSAQLFYFSPKRSFLYDVKEGEKVAIRKAVANVDKIDMIISDIKNESQRFYILYCNSI